MTTPERGLLFHMTSVANLPTIVADGLLCDDLVREAGVLESEIGAEGIKAVRRTRAVPIAPGRTVSSYVPFYFAARSPMLRVLLGSHPASWQDPIVYLVTRVTTVLRFGCSFVFTDRNAYYATARYESDPLRIDELVDWPLMEGYWFNETPDHPDRKEKRMAEFLVEGWLPFAAIDKIGVRSPATGARVREILRLIHNLRFLSRPSGTSEGVNWMIREGTGDLLNADVDALVNTVNTVGVMGKGIALQFKRRYPGNFRAYERACKAGEVQLGSMFVFDAGQLVRPRWIINFPTKGHWRSNSKLTDVASGLDDLVRVIGELGIRSIAIPPLGCGNGGLDWAIVEPLIRDRLSHVDAEVVMFAPAGTPTAQAMVSRNSRPNMTRGKAALVRLVDRYAPPSFGPGLVEVQKLMYFLQESGEALKLKYAKAQYGPYADNLRHSLTAVEGHYLQGYGDGSQRVLESESIMVLPGAVEAADAVLKETPETSARIDRVLRLVEGFESAYGMELLATVHWAATAEQCVDRTCVVDTVHGWSPRKESLFTVDHIAVALDRLVGAGWLPEEFAA